MGGARPMSLPETRDRPLVEWLNRILRSMDDALADIRIRSDLGLGMDVRHPVDFIQSGAFPWQEALKDQWRFVE